MGKKNSSRAVTSLICGICSLPLGIFIIPELSAIAFGVLGLIEVKNNKGMTGKGMAIAGMITGFVFLVLYMWLIAAIIISLSKRGY